MTKKISIGNVNILVLQKATEESVAMIDQIGNVNMVAYSRETAALLARIKIGNINCSAFVPPGAEVQPHMGETVIRAGDLDGESHPPVFMLAMGQLIFGEDLTETQIEKNLAGLVFMGDLIYPDSLANVVQRKTLQRMGSATSYPVFTRVKFGSLTLDERYLDNLPTNIDLAVVGNLNVPKVLSNSRLEQKLQKLFVSGRITCHAENAEVLQSRRTGNSDAVKVIPAGFEWVDTPLTLDRDHLALLPSKKIYCTQRLLITDDIDAAMLDSALEYIVGEELILCPSAAKATFMQKCDVFHSKVVFYEEKLLLVENEDSHGLRVARLNSLKGKATLVVTGTLPLDKEVPPVLLTERLAKVHNLGIIEGSFEQLDAIEALLGLREGELQATETPSTPNQNDDAEIDRENGTQSIGNMNILTL